MMAMVLADFRIAWMSASAVMIRPVFMTLLRLAVWSVQCYIKPLKTAPQAVIRRCTAFENKN
jgi:hypothetical protein